MLVRFVELWHGLKWTLRMGQSILRHLVCDPFDGATRLVLRDHGSSVVGTTYLGCF
ncbi:hypothetical protein LINPERHAP1_LOCUS36956 [Linum perenne]